MLTDEQREERRAERNAKKRDNYRLAREELLLSSILERAPHDSRTLIKGVFVARPTLRGLARTKAEYIVLMWKENMPKMGWRDDAREVIRASKAKS